MYTNKKLPYYDFDSSEDLKLDLPPDEIDHLYEETFNKKEQSD